MAKLGVLWKQRPPHESGSAPVTSDPPNEETGRRGEEDAGEEGRSGGDGGAWEEMGEMIAGMEQMAMGTVTTKRLQTLQLPAPAGSGSSSLLQDDPFAFDE